jgi:putative ABC transport system permease protein
MEKLLQDLKFGLRQLVKHPFLTIMAVATLGLGIGAVSTQMSVVNGLFFKGLPFPESDKLAHLERINVERENYSSEVPITEYLEWVDQQESFDGLAGYYVGTANLTMGKAVERYNGCFLSPNSFEVLQVKAHLGRTLRSEDDDPNAPHVIVLSHKVWKNDFGMDPDIIGTEAVLNGRPATVVGVMPEGFGFPVTEDLWVPLFNQQDRADMTWGNPVMSLEVFGRLKEGVSFEKARSNMAVVASNIEKSHPETNQGFRDVDVKPFIEEYVGGDGVKPMTSVMVLITFLILIIACANVANLLLARSMQRQKEVAIRSALGASRKNILSQFLTESTMIAVLGASLAITLTYFDTKDLNDALVEMNSPFWMSFDLDWRVFIIVAVVTIMTGLMSGIYPAYRASRLNEYEILKDDTRTSTSLHIGLFSKSLVVLQISVAAIILTLVVLFTKSVTNAINIDYHYNADKVMSGRIGLFEENYPDEQARANLVNTLLDNLRARAEVEYASTSHRYQFLNAPWIRYSIPGRTYADPSDRELSRFQYVSKDFLETVQLPILIGEGFKPEDFIGPYPTKVIVNRAFAEREWPGDHAIGKQFQPDFMIEGFDTESLPMVEVVGIVDSMQEAGFFDNEDEDGAAFFAPQTASAMPRFVTILARTKGDPDTLIPVFREELSKIDSNLPIYTTGTPRQLNDKSLVQFRFFASVFRQFGLMATLLAGVGIYGVISFSVNQRIMEFGIRQALGATQAAVFKLVFGHALKQLSIGFVIALAILSPVILSPGIKESLAIFFYKIDHNSLIPYLFSFGFVTVISILAATPPALKAARTHPAQALRYE